MQFCLWLRFRIQVESRSGSGFFFLSFDPYIVQSPGKYRYKISYFIKKQRFKYFELFIIFLLMVYQIGSGFSLFQTGSETFSLFLFTRKTLIMDLIEFGLNNNLINAILQQVFCVFLQQH